MAILSITKMEFSSINYSHGQIYDIPMFNDLHQNSLRVSEFIKNYSEPFRISTPHLYISALPWLMDMHAPDAKFEEQFTNIVRPSDKLLRLQTKDNSQTIQIDNSVHTTTVSGNGMHLTTGFNHGKIRLYDIGSRSLVCQPLTGHEGYVMSVAFSPDGKYIVSGSDDKTIRKWDAHSGTTVCQSLTGHEGYVMSVAFSPDGNYIISGSSDNTVRKWDAQSRKTVV